MIDIMDMSHADTPQDVKDKAKAFAKSYQENVEKQSAAFLKEMKPRMSEPKLPGGYTYWDCFSVGPVQFIGDPPYLPNRIIAAGEWVAMVGFCWVNPLNGPGGSLPGSTVLGSRPYRVRFETMNLSAVTVGPGATGNFVFGAVASVLTGYVWTFRAPNPGANPQLFETNMTMDVTTPKQPMAAFATWHYNPDTENPTNLPIPIFPPVPGHSAGWEYDIPARYMIYPG